MLDSLNMTKETDKKRLSLQKTNPPIQKNPPLFTLTPHYTFHALPQSCLKPEARNNADVDQPVLHPISTHPQPSAEKSYLISIAAKRVPATNTADTNHTSNEIQKPDAADSRAFSAVAVTGCGGAAGQWGGSGVGHGNGDKERGDDLGELHFESSEESVLKEGV